MKKASLLFFFTALALTTTAQIKTNAGTFSKPNQGDLLFEISFAPNLSGTGMFTLPVIAQGQDVYVLEARKFKSAQKAIRLKGNLSIENKSNDAESKTNFTFAVGAGIEHHMTGKERLSTYWGYEGSLGYQTGQNEDNGTDENTFAFAASMFSGFDYYIMPDIYLGLELMYGVGVNSVSYEGGGSETSIKFSPGVTPFLRLGWKL